MLAKGIDTPLEHFSMAVFVLMYIAVIIAVFYSIFIKDKFERWWKKKKKHKYFCREEEEKAEEEEKRAKQYMYKLTKAEFALKGDELLVRSRSKKCLRCKANIIVKSEDEVGTQTRECPRCGLIYYFNEWAMKKYGRTVLSFDEAVSFCKKYRMMNYRIKRRKNASNCRD